MYYRTPLLTALDVALGPLAAKIILK